MQLSGSEPSRLSPRPRLSASPAVLLLFHAGHAHLTAGQVLHWWSFEPFVVFPLILTGALYAIGIRRVIGKTIRTWQAASFALGWLALVAALVSPIDALGGILFSAHMAQHELLMIVAAPLLVLGRPLIVMLWALPPHARARVGAWTQAPAFAKSWQTISGPVAATVLHALALWMWHIPSLYQATLRSDFIHALQHISFFGTAALFWWALIHGRYGRLGYGAAVVYVFVTSAHSGALGALITLSPKLLYPIYAATTAKWGLDAIEDQQLAGLIMWVPASVIFTILGLALFAAWLGEAKRRVALTRSESLRKEPM